VIRLEYRAKGEHRTDEAQWPDIGPDSSPYGASEFWLGVTLAHFDEKGLIDQTPLPRCILATEEELKAMAEELACCGERCCPRCACTRGEACDCPDCPCCET